MTSRRKRKAPNRTATRKPVLTESELEQITGYQAFVGMRLAFIMVDQWFDEGAVGRDHVRHWIEGTDNLLDENRSEYRRMYEKATGVPFG